MINLEEILSLIPHRYPFLLIDKVVELVPNQNIKAIKNVTINEPFFQGHFPNHPVVPGVLLIEALAQTAMVLAIKSSENIENKIMYLISIEKAHFRKLVLPGDTLNLNVDKVFANKLAWKLKGEIFVNDTKVADAAFSAMLSNKK